MTPHRIPIILSLGLFACSAEMTEEGRPCPCAPGNACRVADNVCVAYEREAPSTTPQRCARDVVECAEPEHYIVDTFASKASVGDYLVGRWLLCNGSTTSTLWSDPTIVGIEIDGDGRFALLRNEDGTCVRMFGFEKAGNWTVEDTSEQNGPGVYQVNLGWDAAGFTPIVPAFSGQPRKLRDMGGTLGTFVADQQ